MLTLQLSAGLLCMLFRTWNDWFVGRARMFQASLCLLLSLVKKQSDAFFDSETQRCYEGAGIVSL